MAHQPRTLNRFLATKETKDRLTKVRAHAGTKLDTVRNATSKLREELLDYCGNEAALAQAFDLFLGFLATMPETSLGVNPFHFSQSNLRRESLEEEGDPTHVTTNVPLFKACLMACFPSRAGEIQRVAPLERWLTVVGFQPLGKSPKSLSTVQKASPSLPLLVGSSLGLLKKELDKPAREEIGSSSWCWCKWRTFHCWRELAVDLALDENFPRPAMYDAVWKSRPSPGLRFEIPGEYNFDLRRPSFFGVPCFSSVSEGAPGPLCPLFWRGCTGRDTPYQVQVAGMNYCLQPAEFLEDHGPAQGDVGILLDRISIHSGSDQADKYVEREPPPIVTNFKSQITSLPQVRALFRSTLDDDPQTGVPPNSSPTTSSHSSQEDETEDSNLAQEDSLDDDSLPDLED